MVKCGLKPQMARPRQWGSQFQLTAQAKMKPELPQHYLCSNLNMGGCIVPPEHQYHYPYQHNVANGCSYGEIPCPPLPTQARVNYNANNDNAGNCLQDYQNDK